ncbi:MAG: hypothetical protein IPL01_05805 [Acidobacteria bacterium]|nr:hypothetical protein [Acidobacteriota bacterium]
MTFTKDVAPIFRNKCEECHRSGGRRVSLGDIRRSPPLVEIHQEKVVSREMPPFHASGHWASTNSPAWLMMSLQQLPNGSKEVLVKRGI